ncbi:hypothetical protein DE4585_04541 [Mycobacteroides salmoniphilum]|uniref:HEXXH motif domain protein n=1 Tax=Mycobacteroides salmoniphilum TaxID=404941 RepID=A0A4V3HY89_9MYCO|nr:hypothetical protein [Mycobacteroides salmoniphilum]TDZ78704.1 hypothetical protein DE4585_04541 [Mycobacteroides salmoniphilum]
MSVVDTVRSVVSDEEIDRLVADQFPFGASEYILTSMYAVIDRRLGKLAETVAPARDFYEQLQAVDQATGRVYLQDTSVRIAVLDEFYAKTSGVDEVGPTCGRDRAAVFEQCAEQLRSGERRPPSAVAEGYTLELSGRVPTRIWREERRQDPCTRVFRAASRFYFRNSDLREPTCEQVRQLQQGFELLEALTPNLAHSALQHATQIAVVGPADSGKSMSSGSTFLIPGTFYIGESAFGNPWRTAEYLLHEALHHKFYDFRHAHSVLAELPSEADLSDRALLRVTAPWNIAGASGAQNQWDTHRVFAAFHVYTHLGLLGLAADRLEDRYMSTYGPNLDPNPRTDSRTALDRAYYLGRQLVTTCEPNLGAAGARLAHWLLAVLSELDVSPPLGDRTLPFLLTRYQREARALGEMAGAAEISALADNLARIESDKTRTLASYLPAVDMAQLRVAGALPDPMCRFAATRNAIHGILLRLSNDGGYTLPHPSADTMARSMIDESSDAILQVTRHGVV